MCHLTKSVKHLSLRILPDLLHGEQSADLSSIAQEQIALPSSGARGNPSNILRIYRLMGQDFAGRDQCAQALRDLKRLQLRISTPGTLFYPWAYTHEVTYSSALQMSALWVSLQTSMSARVPFLAVTNTLPLSPLPMRVSSSR